MAAGPEIRRIGWLATFWRTPLSRMLMLSAALHAALIMVVQPRPFPAVTEVVVISARLLGQPAASAVKAAVPAPQPAGTAANPEVRAPAPPSPAQSSDHAAGVTVSGQPAPATSLPSLPVMVDTTWYEARQLDVQPQTKVRITPDYPADAAQRGVEGTVTLKLWVDEFGTVQRLEVEQGSPPGVFDASAVTAFARAPFLPARKDGQPVRALIRVRVRYDLED